jgi:hypothetical protein
LFGVGKRVRKLVGDGVDVVDGGEADLFGVEGVDADGLDFGGGEAGFFTVALEGEPFDEFDEAGSPGGGVIAPGAQGPEFNNYRDR